MKNTIAINNALRYYNTNELVSASNSYKENLSKDLSVTAYNKMLGRICTTMPPSPVQKRRRKRPVIVGNY